MPSLRMYQVKDVARLSGVTVRTLHHYDAIGLLRPSGRTAAGYRLYSDEDLLRLQQIMIGRELGLSLEDIRRALDDPAFDARSALRAQRELLAARAARTAAMLRAIDAALAAIESDPHSEGNVDMSEIFSGFEHAPYAAEAEQRWGHTDAYRVSRQRTESYGAADWRRIRDEQDAIYADARAAMAAGASPDEPRAMDVAERHRASIDRWFYPCTAAMHCGLADLWESDPRFAASIDRHGPGLTRFLAAAVRANARRLAAEM